LAAGPGPHGGLCWSCGRHSSSKAVCGGVCSANQALSWWLAGRGHACGSSGCMIPVRFQDPSLGLVLLLLSPFTHNQLWQYSVLLLFSCPQRRGCLGSVFVVCRVCLHLLSAHVPESAALTVSSHNPRSLLLHNLSQLHVATCAVCLGQVTEVDCDIAFQSLQSCADLYCSAECLIFTQYRPALSWLQQQCRACFYSRRVCVAPVMA
jgi:hypothetical protein